MKTAFKLIFFCAGLVFGYYYFYMPKGVEQTSSVESAQEDAPADSAVVTPSTIIEKNRTKAPSSIELPPDLQEQLDSEPPELPDDLRQQLEMEPPPIPDDLREALKRKPRKVSIDEVNSPDFNPEE